jgi:hypothetical protein
MAYKPNYATGDLIDVNIWQELVNRAIYIFANPAARDNATTGITSPTNGQFCYLLDTTGSGGGAGLQYYNGSAWTNTSLTADITGVTAGNGLSGGGTSGDVTIALDANELSTATAVPTDYVVIEDVTDGSTKKALVSDIINDGDITGVTAGAGISGGGTSGTVTVNVDVTGQSSVTADASDEVMIADASDSNNIKKVSVQSLLDAGGFADIGLVIALG